MIKGSVNPKQSLEGSVIPRGYDGISPTMTVTDIEGGHRITVKDIEGEKFIDVLDGVKGDPFTYADFTPEQLAALVGKPGYTPQKNVDYFDGKDGVSASHRWDGTVLTVTSAAGTSYADLKGEAGYTPQKGVDYNDGVSVTHEWDGTVLRVTSASGTSSVDLKGEQGTGVTILGSYDTEDALNAAHPTGNIGDSYLVNGSLYVWSETENKWINVGNIKGDKGDPGEVDYSRLSEHNTATDSHPDIRQAASDAQAAAANAYSIANNTRALAGDAYNLGNAAKSRLDALTPDTIGAAPTKHTHTKSEITDFPTSMTPTAHTHTKSEITDFPTSMPASDVYSWAKAANKPSYTPAEIGLKAETLNITYEDGSKRAVEVCVK